MSNEAEDEKTLQFHEMGLDDRILEAIARLGWEEPTLIQEKAIPYMLEGKDLLARARTGSGKTGAFVIPAVQKILESKRTATEQFPADVRFVILMSLLKFLLKPSAHFLLINLTLWLGPPQEYWPT